MIDRDALKWEMTLACVWTQKMRERSADKCADIALAHIAAAVEEAASICDEWIALFSGQVINHTRAEEYAEAVVRDIADSIRARIPGSDAHCPWSSPTASEPPT